MSYIAKVYLNDIGVEVTNAGFTHSDQAPRICFTVDQLKALSVNDLLTVTEEFKRTADEIDALMRADSWGWEPPFVNLEQLRIIANSTVASREEKERARNLIMRLFEMGYSSEDIRHMMYDRRTKRKTKKKPRPKPGYVYLFKADNGVYKIGQSVDPDARITSLGVKLPYELESVHRIETHDMNELESDLHDRFADKRLEGEWFELTESDVDYIREL